MNNPYQNASDNSTRAIRAPLPPKNGRSSTLVRATRALIAVPKKGEGRQKTPSPEKKPQRPCFELVIFVQCVLVSCRRNTTHTHMHLVAHLTTSPSSQGHRHYEDARCSSNLKESNTAAPSMVHMLVPAWVAGGALSSRSCNACHG